MSLFVLSDMACTNLHCKPAIMIHIFLFVAAVQAYQSTGTSDGPSDIGQTSVHNGVCKPVQDDSLKSCVCVLEGSEDVINLNGMISNCSYFPDMCKKPRFTVTGNDGWSYSYHPCDVFSLFQNETHIYPGYKPCKNVAASRYTSLSTHECDGLGKQIDGVFTSSWKNKSKYITSNLTLSFQNKTTKDSAVISLVCNSSIPANESTLTFIGIENRPYNTYYMSLESQCCCPNGCSFAFQPAHDRTPHVTKDLWYIVAITGVIIILLGIIVIYFFRRRKPTSPEAQSLLHPS